MQFQFIQAFFEPFPDPGSREDAVVRPPSLRHAEIRAEQDPTGPRQPSNEATGTALLRQPQPLGRTHSPHVEEKGVKSPDHLVHFDF